MVLLFSTFFSLSFYFPFGNHSHQSCALFSFVSALFFCAWWIGLVGGLGGWMGEGLSSICDLCFFVFLLALSLFSL